MAHINLLPWREELRKQQRSEYLTILGITAAVAAAVWGGVHLQYNEMISYQNSRNDYLTTQIQGLDRKIAEIRELERQKERFQVLLDDLVVLIGFFFGVHVVR